MRHNLRLRAKIHLYEGIPVYNGAMYCSTKEKLLDVRTLLRTKRSERQLLEITTSGTKNRPFFTRKRSLRSERIRSDSKDSNSNGFNLKKYLDRHDRINMIKQTASKQSLNSLNVTNDMSWFGTVQVYRIKYLYNSND